MTEPGPGEPSPRIELVTVSIVPFQYNFTGDGNLALEVRIEINGMRFGSQQLIRNTIFHDPFTAEVEQLLDLAYEEVKRRIKAGEVD